MRLKPTPEQAHAIHRIVTEATVTYRPESFSWGGPEDGAINGKEARAICKALSGYNPARSECFACRVKVLNILREAINLPPLGATATEERARARLSICHTCPAYHATTESCGRLILDAIDPTPVKDVDGTFIVPCGCFLPLKVNLKHTQCPAKKW